MTRPIPQNTVRKSGQGHQEWELHGDNGPDAPHERVDQDVYQQVSLEITALLQTHERLLAQSAPHRRDDFLVLFDRGCRHAKHLL
jgi:hypothetical protein